MLAHRPAVFTWWLCLFALFLSMAARALAEPRAQGRGQDAASAAADATAPEQTSPVASQQVNERQIDSIVSELERVQPLFETALSPDGRQIAWMVGTYGGSEIDLASISNPTRFRRITAGYGAPCTEQNIAWSPDSEKLAFTSNCDGGSQSDLYLADVAAGSGAIHNSNPARRLTHLHGAVSSLAFSPDGARIGFLYVEGATREPGALDAMTPPSGVVGIDHLEVQRFASLDLASGETRVLTPANLYVYEFDWAPESRQIAFIAAPPPGENNWWVAGLYTQPLSAAVPQSIFDPSRADGLLHGLQIAVPRWSPDGSRIAFIGGLMSDQGVTGGDIYLLPRAGGTPQPLTGRLPAGSLQEGPRRGADFTSVWIHWSGRNKLIDSVIRGGETSVLELALKIPSPAPGGCCATSPAPGIPYQARRLFSDSSIGDGRLDMSLSLSADNREVAFIRSSFNQAPEVWEGSLIPSGVPSGAAESMRSAPRGSASESQLRAITSYNAALRPTWGRATSIEWSDGNFHLQGWLLYPANYHPGKKYPLIVSVHGGPSGAVVPYWPSLGYNPIAFSTLGYFVFMPNPRGSYGQGETFTQANRRDFGYGDLRDILAGVDAVSAGFPIDQQRIGLTGWSYGGFMTMFAVTQTQRFRAAVAGAGISNWQSYYGENSIDQWVIPFFGASVYDDPAVYARSSAINYIKNAKTPTLIVVGDRDGECPAPQSFEFWHALRAEHVPARLVVYADEGHRFSAPGDRRDVLERALLWFQQYMPEQNIPAPSMPGQQQPEQTPPR